MTYLIAAAAFLVALAAGFAGGFLLALKIMAPALDAFLRAVAGARKRIIEEVKLRGNGGAETQRGEGYRCGMNRALEILDEEITPPAKGGRLGEA